MTVITVDNEQKRKPLAEEAVALGNRFWDLHRRFTDGKLDPNLVIANLQFLAEGNAIATELDSLEQHQARLKGYLEKIEVPSINILEFEGFEMTTRLSVPEVAASALGMVTFDGVLKQLLVRKGIIFTMKEVLDLSVRTQNGEDVGLARNGRTNLFFIHDDQRGVLVVNVSSSGPQENRSKVWHAHTFAFDCGMSAEPGGRFFSRTPLLNRS